MNFVNLYIETEYTMLESPIKISSLMKKAKFDSSTALAMTDLNNMHGAIKFYKEAVKNNIKPIIGLHAILESKGNFYNSILIYAMNSNGYKNLLTIASASKTVGKVTLEFLSKHSSDVLAIIPNEENEIIKLVLERDFNKAKYVLNEYKKIFSELYIGVDLQTNEARREIVNVINFGKDTNTKLVALNKTAYLEEDDFEAYQMLRCIDLGMNQYLYQEKEAFLKYLGPKTASNLFRDYPDLINNTVEISNKCNLVLEFGIFKLPVFPDALGRSFEYLTELCKHGLNKRLAGLKVDFTNYTNRLFYELKIINQMGFCDYFLIVYDFIKYAKKNNVMVGPGRGSAPGSLVAYALGITEVDPLKYDLLFERFLNPERITMPDIDTDFPDNKRDDVIQYVLNKYGSDKIAHISTFGTFGVKLAVRDVARVMMLNEVTINEILKFVPDSNTPISEIIEKNPMFQDLIKSNYQVSSLVKLVLKIEGLPRHTSTHAAGLIIADKELVNYTALQAGLNGVYQTQFEASDLEEIGLVKMDFLGIRNLTIIDAVIDMIKEEEPGFNINKIDLDDSYTYKMIASGDTDGIFQLESSGMRSVLMGLKSSEFMDIVNSNALYRPGPRDMIPSFIKRKFNEEPIDYIHPDLKPILESTYGIIVFQEQIMLIAQKFAGYTLGMADILRRAMSKKNIDVLMKERDRFVSSSVKNGYDAKISNIVYDYIEKFASYGFNKSHSVVYSLISYQMAYLKRRYYRKFMVVLMTNSIGQVGLIRSYINDCTKKNVVVNGPSVNISSEKFVVQNNEIYYSLLGIQNLGAISLRSLLEERRANGPYKDYDSFVSRTKDILNKRIVESMIWAGAMDEFGLARKQMAEGYDNSVALSNYSSMLSDNLSVNNYSDEEYSFEEISNLERISLGFNLKYNIFSKYQDFMKREKTVAIKDLKVANFVRVLFAVKSIREIVTKNKDEMAFVMICDDTDELDAVIFPKVYTTYKNELAVNKVYMGTGNVDVRNGKKQYIISKLMELK